MKRLFPGAAAAVLAVALAACEAPTQTASANATAGVMAAACPAQEVAGEGPTRGMVYVSGGPTLVGSDKFHAEEAPQRELDVAGFWIDTHEVTNADFAAFVKATGYVTLAERDRAGGAVFFKPREAGGREDLSQWWRVDNGATWRTPSGRSSSIEGRERHPVVQIAYEDALAYAQWRGRDLPTEAEWERAARGGLKDAEYVWGDESHPDGKFLANHWQGVFPVIDSGQDGFKGAAPVGCYPANGYGLYDMAGNVWEWVKDPWDGGDPNARVIKGGSFLCSDEFCHRYRPPARQPGDASLGTSHVGFRTVLRGPAPAKTAQAGASAG